MILNPEKSHMCLVEILDDNEMLNLEILGLNFKNHIKINLQESRPKVKRPSDNIF